MGEQEGRSVGSGSPQLRTRVVFFNLAETQNGESRALLQVITFEFRRFRSSFDPA